MVRRALQNPVVQALLLGALLFFVSASIRVVANMIVGAFTAGPGPFVELLPGNGAGPRVLNILVFGVLLPALVETPFVVFPVRRTNLERTSIALWVVVTVIAGFAWLLHGASPGSLGQAAAFALIAYAGWGWSRRCGRSSYALTILAHAVWNGIGAAIYIVPRVSMWGN